MYIYVLAFHCVSSTIASQLSCSALLLSPDMSALSLPASVLFMLLGGTSLTYRIIITHEPVPSAKLE